MSDNAGLAFLVFCQFVFILGILFINLHHTRHVKALNKTAKQKGEISRLAFKQDNWKALIRDEERVEWEDHYKAILSGKDPMLLYTQRIRDMMAYDPDPITADNVVRLN